MNLLENMLNLWLTECSKFGQLPCGPLSRWRPSMVQSVQPSTVGFLTSRASSIHICQCKLKIGSVSGQIYDLRYTIRLKAEISMS